MTRFVFPGFGLSTSNGQPDGAITGVIEVALTIVVPDGSQTFSYQIVQTYPGDLPEVEITDSVEFVAFNSLSEEMMMGFGNDVEFSIGQVSWGSGNVTQILTAAVRDSESDTTIVFPIGGTPVPAFTSAADAEAFMDSITNIGPIPPGTPLSEGQDIAFGSLATATTLSDNAVPGTEGDDTLLGTAGNDFFTPLGNDGDDVIFGSAGHDLMDFSVSGEGDFYSLVYSGLNAGISVDLDRETGFYLVDKGANGIDNLVDAERALNWTTGDGMMFVGSAHDDTFEIKVPVENTWVGIKGGEGADSYVIDAVGIVRISFAGGYGQTDPIAGAVLDLNSGVVSNDGFGNAEQITVNSAEVRVEIEGTARADSIVGSARDERFALLGGDDTLDGGSGWDELRYDRSGVDEVNVDLESGTAVGSYNGVTFTHQIGGIEAVRGSRLGSDVLIGDGLGNWLDGRGGDDSLSGGAGEDTLMGGDGDDIMYGGDGYDRVEISASMIAVQAVDGGLWVTSSEGKDFIADDIELIAFADMEYTYGGLASFTPAPIDGDEGSNTLYGTAGGEEINGYGGYDWIVPGRGDDTVDGGSERDMVSYSDQPEVSGRTGLDFMLDLDLGAGTAELFGGETDVLRNIERVTGTIFADVLRGSAGDDELRGIGDYDWFIATAGNDTLDGGNGQDMVTFLEWGGTGAAVVEDVFAGAPPTGAAVGGVLLDLANPGNSTGLAAGLTLVSVERVTGSSYQDVFYGDDQQNDFRGLGGYDWFVGSTGGRERYFGGDGLDTVTYYQSTSGVTASLRNGNGLFNGQETGYGSTGDAVRDLYFEIENLVGTQHRDRLEGNSERNQLAGLGDDDFLYGYGGTDYIEGGDGNDYIDGGAGSDFALYAGARSDYTITRTSATDVTITGEGFTDTLTNVEYFRFDDADANIWQFAIL